jgi:DNA-binding NarL/FixJ family response regulator
MRIVIVGGAAARARLAALLPDGIEVVGEARTLGAAREASASADAFLVAPGRPADPAPHEIDPLTARELDVLELLALGHANKAIAARLGIGPQTVKFHVASICGKLGAANRTDAARRAFRYGLVAL